MPIPSESMEDKNWSISLSKRPIHCAQFVKGSDYLDNINKINIMEPIFNHIY